MITYTRFEGFCYIEFHNAITNKKLFSIIADIDRRAEYTSNNVVVTRAREFDICIKGGEYDGVVLVKDVRFDEVTSVLNAIAFSICNNLELRRTIALFVSHNQGQLLMINYAETRE